MRRIWHDFVINIYIYIFKSGIIIITIPSWGVKFYGFIG